MPEGNGTRGVFKSAGVMAVISNLFNRSSSVKKEIETLEINETVDKMRF